MVFSSKIVFLILPEVITKLSYWRNYFNFKKFDIPSLQLPLQSQQEKH